MRLSSLQGNGQQHQLHPLGGEKNLACLSAARYGGEVSHSRWQLARISTVRNPPERWLHWMVSRLFSKGDAKVCMIPSRSSVGCKLVIQGVQRFQSCVRKKCFPQKKLGQDGHHHRGNEHTLLPSLRSWWWVNTTCRKVSRERFRNSRKS